MPITLLIRVPFVLLIASGFFYLQSVIVATIICALVAWIGFEHPASNSVAQEVISFLVSYAIGTGAFAVLWLAMFRRNPLVIVFNDVHLFAGKRPSTRTLTLMFLSLFLLGAMFVVTEGLGYERTVVHRWCAMASLILVLFIAFMYDRNVSDVFSHHGIYRMLGAEQAHYHLWVAVFCSAAITIDCMIRQSAWQNLVCGCVIATFLVTRIDTWIAMFHRAQQEMKRDL